MKTWTGDFNGMVERRHIRALVTFSMTNYFLDGAEQRGITYEAMKEFEKSVNADLGTGHLKVHVLIVPVARDQLNPKLLEGRGDIAAANLTITPEREELVDFSVPAYTGVSEIVITGPSAPEITDIQDLSGKEVHVRASSSYYASLQKLNDELQASGKEAVRVVSSPLTTRDRRGYADCGVKPSRPASIRTSGSTTSKSSLPRRSEERRCST